MPGQIEGNVRVCGAYSNMNGVSETICTNAGSFSYSKYQKELEKEKEKEKEKKEEKPDESDGE